MFKKIVLLFALFLVNSVVLAGGFFKVNPNSPNGKKYIKSSPILPGEYLNRADRSLLLREYYKSNVATKIYKPVKKDDWCCNFLEKIFCCSRRAKKQ